MAKADEARAAGAIVRWLHRSHRSVFLFVVEIACAGRSTRGNGRPLKELRRVALATLVATTAAFEVIMVAGVVAVAPLLSAKAVATAIHAGVDRDAQVVFEAPI